MDCDGFVEHPEALAFKVAWHRAKQGCLRHGAATGRSHWAMDSCIQHLEIGCFSVPPSYDRPADK